MSKIRDIKKDIRYLCEQLIVDSIEVAELVGEIDQKKILELISEIAVFHNELIARSNHPDGKDNIKLVKAHFKKISNDLLSGCNHFYDRLNKLVPSEK
jgi:phage regulator Rha-like protein